MISNDNNSTTQEHACVHMACTWGYVAHELQNAGSQWWSPPDLAALYTAVIPRIPMHLHFTHSNGILSLTRILPHNLVLQHNYGFCWHNVKVVIITLMQQMPRRRLMQGDTWNAYVADSDWPKSAVDEKSTLGWKLLEAADVSQFYACAVGRQTIMWWCHQKYRIDLICAYPNYRYK